MCEGHTGNKVHALALPSHLCSTHSVGRRRAATLALSQAHAARQKCSDASHCSHSLLCRAQMGLTSASVPAPQPVLLAASGLPDPSDFRVRSVHVSHQPALQASDGAPLRSGAHAGSRSSLQAPQPLFVRTLGPLRAMRSRFGVPLPIRRVRVFCQVWSQCSTRYPKPPASLLGDPQRVMAGQRDQPQECLG